MKISAAQTKSIKGDIESNIIGHKKLIDLAVFNQAEIIIFPELSLTGYEPTLAHSLAIYPNDSRLEEFQKISDDKKVVIGVGVPTWKDKDVCISMIIFQPEQDRRVYSKKYLHPDEEDFFVRGQNFPVMKVRDDTVAFAICYEISVLEHAENAFEYGADIYIASVAKFEGSIDAAAKRLSEIAKKYSITVLMANCIGQADGLTCAGKTSAWNNKGELVAQLNDHQEGIVILDTETLAVITRLI